MQHNCSIFRTKNENSSTFLELEEDRQHFEFRNMFSVAIMGDNKVHLLKCLSDT